MAYSHPVQIRKILPGDNIPLSKIISDIVINEFKGNPATTIAGDPSLQTMYENYQGAKSVYYVALQNGEIAGGCGIRQLDGGPEHICELQRMFLHMDARGRGTGKKLFELCLADAKKFGFNVMYLETLSQMKAAIAFYESAGFKRIPNRLGLTGHTGCDINMVLDLNSVAMKTPSD
jgi:putative acetyltransferase